MKYLLKFPLQVSIGEFTLLGMETFPEIPNDAQDNQIKFSVPICFTRAQKLRWKSIQQRMKSINPKLKATDYGREALLALMDQLEAMCDAHEARSVNPTNS